MVEAGGVALKFRLEQMASENRHFSLQRYVIKMATQEARKSPDVLQGHCDLSGNQSLWILIDSCRGNRNQPFWSLDCKRFKK